MCKALIIGAGGVGTVVTQKIAANPVFTDVMLASRTKSKCDAVAAAIGGGRVKTAQVDADNVAELCELFRAFRPDIVVNVALALPGSDDHGRLPRMRLQLPRHGQLRAQGRGAFRIFVAVGLPGSFQGRGADGDPRLRFRSGRYGHLHGLCRQAPFRRDSLPRHRGLQRGQPRHGFRHELQPRDQHPRGDAEGALFRERRVGYHRAA